MCEGGIGQRPIFNGGRQRAGEIKRFVMRLGTERDDQIEIQAFPIIQFINGARFVLMRINADLLQHRRGEGIDIAFGHARRLHINGLAEIMAGNGFGHG